MLSPRLKAHLEYKKLPQPRLPLNSQDFGILKEIYAESQRFRETNSKNDMPKFDDILKSYEKVMFRHGISLKNDSKFYRFMLKLCVKGKPWTEILDEYQNREQMKMVADGKFYSNLMAKYLLKWISALVDLKRNSVKFESQSKDKGKENSSKKSNESTSMYFTFAKKDQQNILSGREDFSAREPAEFSAHSSTQKPYIPSSRRLDKMFDNLNYESGYKIQLKYLRKWKRMVIEAKKRRAEKEKHMENWLVAIHFYEQTLCSKGLLGLLHNRQDTIQIENIGEELEISHSMFLLKTYFVLWKNKFCIFLYIYIL